MTIIWILLIHCISIKIIPFVHSFLYLHHKTGILSTLSRMATVKLHICRSAVIMEYIQTLSSILHHIAYLYFHMPNDLVERRLQKAKGVIITIFPVAIWVLVPSAITSAITSTSINTYTSASLIYFKAWQEKIRVKKEQMQQSKMLKSDISTQNKLIVFSYISNW